MEDEKRRRKWKKRTLVNFLIIFFNVLSFFLMRVSLWSKGD